MMQCNIFRKIIFSQIGRKYRKSPITRQPLVLQIFKPLFDPKGVKISFYVYISRKIWNFEFFFGQITFFP